MPTPAKRPAARTSPDDRRSSPAGKAAPAARKSAKMGAKMGAKGAKGAQASARGSKAKPASGPALRRERQPDGMSVEDWQLGLRRQYGSVQSFSLRKLDAGALFGDWEVHNPESGGRYRVTLRGSVPGVNRCTCADFEGNALGTCKHVEFLLARLQARRGAKAELARGFRPAWSEVVLRQGARHALHWRPGCDCPDPLAQQAQALLDEHGELPADDERALPALQRAADEVGHELRIEEQAWSLVAARRDARRRVQRLGELFPGGAASPALLTLLAEPLLPYQAEGALFAVGAGRCLIADEMGLGKTVQAIAAARLLQRHFGVERILVVAPTSLKHQWQREWARFCAGQGMASGVVQGGPAARRLAWADAAKPLKIASFEQLDRDLVQIQAFQPELVIVDEAQRVKNWNTLAARALRRIDSPYAIVLTGTPLENRLEELLAIVQYVDPHRLGPTWRFLHEHQQRDESGRVVGYRALDRIGRTLEAVMMRRHKAEVLPQLPERSDDTRLVPLTPAQRQLHDEHGAVVARIVQRWRRTGYLSDADQRRLTCALQSMRMACNGTRLVDPAGPDFAAKLDELEPLLGELLEREGCKVVIFSQWVRTHELIEARLARRGLGSVRFTGSVPAEQRGDLVRRFHQDPDCRVFLSTDAGSAGLNLQHAAAVVVNMDLPWNPAVLEQRIGRVHRLGQTRGVQVITLVAQASIEEGLLGTLAFKRDLAAGVLDGGESEVFLSGSRLSRFMDEVSAVTEAAQEPLPETQDPPPAQFHEGDAASLQRPDTGVAPSPPRPGGDATRSAPPGPAGGPHGATPAPDWRPLVEAAAHWLSALARSPQAAPRWHHDAGSGQAGLFVPVPDDAALRTQLAAALNTLADGLSAPR